MKSFFINTLLCVQPAKILQKSENHGFALIFNILVGGMACGSAEKAMRFRRDGLAVLPQSFGGNGVSAMRSRRKRRFHRHARKS